MKVQGQGDYALHLLEDLFAHAGQSKTLKCVTFGFLLHHASKGVFPSKARCGDRLRMWVALLISSTSNDGSRDLACIMQLAMDLRVWILKATTSVLCGLNGAGCWRSMPSSLHKSVSLLFTYLVPLSIQRNLMTFLDLFSTWVLKARNLSNTSFLWWRK